MSGFRRAWLRLLNALFPHPAERELSRELAAHQALLEDEFRRCGMTADEARAAARRSLGSVEHVRDLHRDARSFTWIDDAKRDVRYSARTLARTPTFTAVAVLTLALGIGANSAIFSVINSVLLKPLPYPDADRLVRLMMTIPAESSSTGVPQRFQVGLSADEAARIQGQVRTLSDLVVAGPELLGLQGYEEAARLQGARVTATALQLLGARPALGRLLTAGDQRAGATPVVLVSYSAWQRYFGGDPGVVGRPLTFDSVLGPRRQTVATVIGVIADGFEFPRAGTQFWMPLAPTPAGGRGVARGAIVGKLREGVTAAAATAEIEPLIREVRQGQFGNDRATYELTVEQDEVVAPVRLALLVLSAAVSLVLLIACINVANLLLARARVRQTEVAIRAALGASRSRLVRQALTESVVLGLLGGVLGAGLAFGGVWLLRSLATTLARFDVIGAPGFPRLDEIGVDARVLAVTIAVSALAGILFGLVPAIRYSRSDHLETLKDGRLPIRSVLVVAEVSLSMVLLVGAGLLIHSFARLSAVDTGYDASGVLTFQVALPNDRYPTDRLKQFAEDLVARLRRVPGVEVAAYANQLPLIGIRDTGGGLWRTPDPERPPGPAPGQDLRIVSRDYLDAMRIRILSGRGFMESDVAGRPQVLLINQTLARQEFPGENPLGRLVYIGRDVTPWEIVGVVSDVRQFGIDQAPQAQMFADMRQWSREPLVFMTGAYYVVRAADDPATLVPLLRGVVGEVDPAGRLFNVAPMERLVASTVARPRMYAVLLGVFAAVGATLAVIGIYGVLAYSVAQRTREIGIRIALGAKRSEVLRLVLKQSLVVTGVGIVIGLVGAAMLTRYLDRLLFELTPLDLSTFAVVVLLFVVVAALASYAPARRATRVDPLVALRYE
jgi:putative ABC transport system permease protein